MSLCSFGGSLLLLGSSNGSLASLDLVQGANAIKIGLCGGRGSRQVDADVAGPRQNNPGVDVSSAQRLAVEELLLAAVKEVLDQALDLLDGNSLLGSLALIRQRGVEQTADTLVQLSGNK